MQNAILLTKTNKKKHDYGRTVFMILMMLVPAVHFAFFWIYVNIDTISLSFQSLDYMTGDYVPAGMRNYVYLWQELTKEGSALPTAIKNSFTLFLWNDFIIVPISILCAFVLSKKMPFGSGFKVIFFLPSIISVVVLTTIFQFMFDSTLGCVNIALEKMGLENIIPQEGWFGSKNTAFKMILFYGLWTGIGANIVLLTGAITRIPEDLFEAGRLDGLGLWGELWHLVVPLIGTTTSTLMLMGTTVIFTYFLQPMLLTGANSANVGTFTIALYIVNNVRDVGNYSLGSAVGVICIIVGTPIVLLVRKLLDWLFPAYEY